MISGINPYTISSITYKKFCRYGPHPSWTKVMKKRNPIRGFFGQYNDALFDGIYRPHIVIRGSNNNILQCIECHSNDHAKELCEKLNKQLSDWVARNECKFVNR